MKKVPTWLAMNSFATGRFNQLDDRLPAEVGLGLGLGLGVGLGLGLGLG